MRSGRKKCFSGEDAKASKSGTFQESGPMEVKRQRYAGLRFAIKGPGPLAARGVAGGFPPAIKRCFLLN